MSMFCFQCEQTAAGRGCSNRGVCGKDELNAHTQDRLTGALITLARTCAPTPANDKLIIDGLFTTVTNVSFDAAAIEELTARARAASGRPDYEMSALWSEHEDTRSLKSLLLFGMRGMAAYAHHARALGKTSREVNDWFYKGLAAIPEEKPVPEWLDLLMDFGKINLSCMALLDEANTGAYGTPAPAKVPTDIEKGPFIVVSGHDLRDLKMLLEQTDGKGVNIYTHGEMLPAHAYPELRRHPQLKGNFGTAWQNQQKEFADLPAPALFTTNCLMIPRPSYGDRVFTTSVVGYPGLRHIPHDEQGNKDFSEVIALATSLGGYPEKHEMSGINGGHVLTTGFGHGTILSVADKVVGAVKAGAIKHFFLVGGCDGARPGRNYYTDFVKQTPKDTVVLTLACGKFRFNDLDIGEIGGLPRLMDMGQCNDAYGAIRVAVALAEAFGCGVNDLPLTLVLSWYEQKAVCILLTLLSLGIKNIYIGPSLPAFISPAVLDVLVKQFALTPISTPEEDLKKILG